MLKSGSTEVDIELEKQQTKIIHQLISDALEKNCLPNSLDYFSALEKRRFPYGSKLQEKFKGNTTLTETIYKKLRSIHCEKIDIKSLFLICLGYCDEFLECDILFRIYGYYIFGNEEEIVLCKNLLEENIGHNKNVNQLYFEAKRSEYEEKYNQTNKMQKINRQKENRQKK